MADDTKTEEEPSIEEILDSIRQIISEDDDEIPADDSEESSPEKEADPAPDEPLDQSAIDDMDFSAPATEPASDEAPTADPAPDEPLDQSAIDDMDFSAPAAEPASDDEIYELTDRVEDNSENESINIDAIVAAKEEAPVAEEAVPEIQDPVVAPPAAAAPSKNADLEDNLLTGKAEEAAFSAIQDLARKTAVEHNGVTLEDIVRSEIKPMLKTWLDKNLPVMIERLVQEELERVSKRVLEE